MKNTIILFGILILSGIDGLIAQTNTLKQGLFSFEFNYISPDSSPLKINDSLINIPAGGRLVIKTTTSFDKTNLPNYNRGGMRERWFFVFRGKRIESLVDTTENLHHYVKGSGPSMTVFFYSYTYIDILNSIEEFENLELVITRSSPVPPHVNYNNISVFFNSHGIVNIKSNM